MNNSELMGMIRAMEALSMLFASVEERLPRSPGAYTLATVLDAAASVALLAMIGGESAPEDLVDS